MHASRNAALCSTKYIEIKKFIVNCLSLITVVHYYMLHAIFTLDIQKKNRNKFHIILWKI